MIVVIIGQRTHNPYFTFAAAAFALATYVTYPPPWIIQLKNLLVGQEIDSRDYDGTVSVLRELLGFEESSEGQFEVRTGDSIVSAIIRPSGDGEASKIFPMCGPAGFSRPKRSSHTALW